MDDLKSIKWEESYKRNENFIFYPQTEVVKFLNRYIRKKFFTNQFIDILSKGETEFKALDFGCGIGRNTLLFEEFNICGYGVDISSNAISIAKEMAAHSYPTNTELQNRFLVIDSEILPFDNDYFDFAVSDSVLDSMYFTIAKKIVTELDRTVKNYLFITVISDPKDNSEHGKEIIVNSTHENGTVQSFFTLQKISQLVEGTRWKIKWISLINECQLTTKIENERFYVVLEK